MEVGAGVVLGVAEGFLVVVTFTVGLAVGFAVAEELGDAVLVALALGEGEAVVLGLAVGEAVAVGLAVGLGVGDSSAKAGVAVMSTQKHNNKLRADFLNMQTW